MVDLTPINIGQAPNDATGDKARVAFTKVNENFGAVGDALAAKASQEGLASYSVAILDAVEEELEALARAGAVLDPYRYDLNFDGTNETTAFQAYLNACRDQGRGWVLPGSLIADGLFAYTPLVAVAPGAKIIAYNAGQSHAILTIAPLPGDVASIPSSEFSTWGNLGRGSAKVSGLTGRRGQYITIQQDDVLIGRANGQPALKQAAGILVWSDAGNIVPPIRDPLTWPGTNTVVTAINVRERMEVKGLVFELRNPVSGSPVERNKVMQVTRPNTVVTASVLSTGTAGAQQGFAINSTCLVKFTGCTIDNIVSGTGTTEYGWNPNVSALVTIEDCHARSVRRAIDGQSTVGIKVRGGSFDGGVGGHWVHDLDVEGATISMDNPTGTGFPFWVSGSNFRARGNKISLTGFARGVLGIRSDLYEMRGALDLSKNRITIDNGAGQIGTEPFLALVEMSGPNVGDTYNALRPVSMPSLVTVEDNTITFLGAGSLDLVRVGKAWTASTQPVTMEGRIAIRRNAVDFAGGSLLNSFGNPRLSVVVGRSTIQAGAGYRIEVEGLPCLYSYAKCAADAVNGTSRHSLHYSLIPGAIRLAHDYGAYRATVLVDCATTITQGLATPAQTTPVGDETTVQQISTDVRRSGTTIGIGGDAGKASLNVAVGDYANTWVVTGAATGTLTSLVAQGPNGAIIGVGANDSLYVQTNVAAGAATQFRVRPLVSATSYLQVSGSTSDFPFIQGNGSAANIDTGILPKGAGHARFGTYTAGAPTPTGYVEIKSEAGSVLRLPAQLVV